MGWTYRGSWYCAKRAEEYGVYKAPPGEPCDCLNSENLECGSNNISTRQVGFIVALEKERNGNRGGEEYLEWRHYCCSKILRLSLTDVCWHLSISELAGFNIHDSAMPRGVFVK